MAIVRRLNRILEGRRVGIPVLFFLIFIHQVSPAQELNSLEIYYSAQRSFAEGRLDTTLSLLNSCISNKRFTRQLPKTDQLEVYRLAALSNYLDYQPEKAKFYVKKMLQLDPDYSLNFRDDDLSEFRAEVLNQDVLPVLQLSVFGGFGRNSISVLGETQHLLEALPDQPDPYMMTGYKGKGGFHFGVGLEQTIAKKWRMVLDYYYSRITYSYDADYHILNNDYTFDYDQLNSYHGLQLFGKYCFVPDTRKRFGPYLAGGGYFLGLISSTRTINGSDYFVRDLMNRYNFGYLLGVGITLKKMEFNIRSGHLYANIFQLFNGTNLNLELKYLGSIRNLNDVNRSYDFTRSNKFLFQYYHVPENINMRQIMISLGISWPLTYWAFDR